MTKLTLQTLFFTVSLCASISNSFTQAATIHSNRPADIFRRQDRTCGGDTSLEQCGNGLPDDFCCAKGFSCLKLNNDQATSTICCPPDGQGCQFIEPIQCDIQLQNATAFPKNQVHLADLSVELPTCGEACCPLGYECKNNMCVMSSTPSGDNAPSTTQTPKPTNSNAPAPALSETEKPQCAAFPGGAVVAGFFPGLILGILLTLAIIWAVKRRREGQQAKRGSGDFGSVTRQISDPIYDPAYAARVDFIRRGTNSTKASNDPMLANANVRQQQREPSIMPRGLFGRSPKPLQSPYTSRPVTQIGKSRRPRHSSVARSGSTETIEVLMPAPSFLQPPPALSVPGGGERPENRNTTFSSIMADAGFGRHSRNGVRNFSTR